MSPHLLLEPSARVGDEGLGTGRLLDLRFKFFLVLIRDYAGMHIDVLFHKIYFSCKAFQARRVGCLEHGGD